MLGQKLRQFRETRRESLAEVSGAVEIDTELLERIERGEECPTEDILTLLISHFSLREQDAVELWEWAGFPRNPDAGGMQEVISKAAVVLVALDARVLYSDHSDITTSEHGLVMTFTQSATQQAQQIPVARVGMSYEHAQKVLIELQTALLRQKYQPPHKLLPPGAAS